MRKFLVLVLLAWLAWILVANADKPSPPTDPAAPGDVGLAPSPSASEGSESPARTYRVAYVVDGDTLVLASGLTVRLRGIDAPERSECASDRSTRSLSRLIMGERVRLVRAGDDKDRYGRLLRYVDVGEIDAGLRQIERGLAIARYDSRDGYGLHPRQDAYVEADAASRAFAC